MQHYLSNRHMSLGTDAYRRDIDGLRAIAILGVLLYHLNPAWAPNGYLGVNAFFVISGYLITRSIYPHLISGSFSLRDYYRRRLIRLMPALLAVLAVCTLGAILLFPPEWDYVVFNRSLVTSFFSVENIYLARGTGYFSPDANTKPLLHLWSLSMEMQFYLCIPLLLMGLMRIFKQWRWLLISLLGVLALLMGLTLWGGLQLSFYHGYDYYLPHRRFMELLIGVLLSVYTWHRPISYHGSTPSAIALRLLILSFLIPGIILIPMWEKILFLLPCFLVGYLLLRPRNSNGILSHPALTYIGRRSYSIYLWHWPLLAFTRYIYGAPSPLQMIVIIGITALLAHLSYRYIERKQWATLSLGHTLLCWGAIPALIIGLLQILPPTQPDPSLEFGQGKVINYQGQDVQGQGILGHKDSIPTVLIVGNSHTLELGECLDAIGQHEGWSAYAISSYVAPYIHGFRSLQSRYYYYSRDRNRIVRDHILSGQYRHIILPADWGIETYQNEENLPKLNQTLIKLKEKGLGITMLCTYSPVDNHRYREYHHRRMGLGWLYRQTESVDYKGKSYRQNRANLDKLSKWLKTHHPEVRFIDMTAEIPDTLLHNGKPIYRDPHHFARHWTEHLSRLFLRGDYRLIELSPTAGL